MESFMKDMHYIVLKEIHLAITISLLVFVILEFIRPGIVSSYIQLNYWLIGWIISGILIVYSKKNT